MKKLIRKVKASLIFGVLLFSIFSIFTIPLTSHAEAREKRLTYPALISVQIDEASLEKLNQPINIDTALLVKLKIGYSVGVPENLLNPSGPIFGMIARLWVFGATIVFPQQIHLSIEGKPEWADIALLNPDVYIENFSNGYTYTTADLVITPYFDAPAVPKSITITAEAKALGRIQPVTYTTNLMFQPDFIPLITVSVDQPVRQVGPRQAVNYQMTIRNMGNKEAIVKSTIEDNATEWAPLLTPSEVPIAAGQEAKITFSVTTPYNFGWHDEIRTFTISLVPERSPPTTPPIIGSPHVVQVSVNSVGFAIPGFEPILLFAGIVIILAIIRLRKKK
jgi:hypothetical protein